MSYMLLHAVLSQTCVRRVKIPIATTVCRLPVQCSRHERSTCEDGLPIWHLNQPIWHLNQQRCQCTNSAVYMCMRIGYCHHPIMPETYARLWVSQIFEAPHSALIIIKLLQLAYWASKYSILSLASMIFCTHRRACFCTSASGCIISRITSSLPLRSAQASTVRRLSAAAQKAARKPAWQGSYCRALQHAFDLITHSTTQGKPML